MSLSNLNYQYCCEKNLDFLLKLDTGEREMYSFLRVLHGCVGSCFRRMAWQGKISIYRTTRTQHTHQRLAFTRTWRSEGTCPRFYTPSLPPSPRRLLNLLGKIEGGKSATIRLSEGRGRVHTVREGGSTHTANSHPLCALGVEVCSVGPREYYFLPAGKTRKQFTSHSPSLLLPFRVCVYVCVLVSSCSSFRLAVVALLLIKHFCAVLWQRGGHSAPVFAPPRKQNRPIVVKASKICATYGEKKVEYKENSRRVGGG